MNRAQPSWRSATMSTPKMTLGENGDIQSSADATNAEQPTHEAEDEYALLRKKLRELEIKYKLGDVDPSSDEETGVRVWDFEGELNEAERLIDGNRERLMRESPAWFYEFQGMQAEAKNYFNTKTTGDLLDLYQWSMERYK